MSFLPAVQRQVAARAANDPVRMTLEYMLARPEDAFKMFAGFFIGAETVKKLN